MLLLLLLLQVLTQLLLDAAAAIAATAAIAVGWASDFERHLRLRRKTGLNTPGVRVVLKGKKK